MKFRHTKSVKFKNSGKSPINKDGSFVASKEEAIERMRTCVHVGERECGGGAEEPCFHEAGNARSTEGGIREAQKKEALLDSCEAEQDSGWFIPGI